MSKLDFRLVNDRALQSVDSVLSSWLPGGKRQGGEYVVTNPRRSDSRPGSFSINTTNGIWSDFATGDKGGDLIALVAYVDSAGMGDACRSLASFLGIDPEINGKPSNQVTSQRQPPTKPKPVQPDFEPIRPIPEAALKACPTSIRNLGKPSMYWDYLGEDGKQILLRVMRFDKPNPNGRTKDYRPWCYGKDKSGKTGWRSKMPTTNRPLYGLGRLASTPTDAPVLLCEGEKAADAAQGLFPGAVAMTWPSGSKSINKADFSPLASRTVWYWRDNDAAGQDSIEPLKKALSAAGVASVVALNIELFNKYQPGKTKGKASLLNAKDPDQWPEKADAADAVALGWTANHIALLMEKGLIHAPAPQIPPPPSNDSTNEQGQPNRFKEGSDGIYYFSPKFEKYQFVGGPLKVLARSRDKLSEGWGLLVEFEDYDKQTKVWNIPGCYLVSEGGNKAVEGLIHRGYMLSPQRDAKNQLREFLGGYNTPERVRLVNRIGWQGKDAFMLPDKVIGKPQEPLHYYSDSDLCKISTSGNLEQWKENIAKYGNKNIFLTFALSTAFAGPFIDIKDTELFGVHFFGDSSLGKTTLLEMAASVYGNPDKGEYTKTWRTTSNALEGMAAAHSDCLLVLDEIGQIEPRIVGETVYSLCSGVGKSRANETGSNRGNQHRWRICFLSSGEKTLADHMGEANQKPKAGQEIRMLAVSPSPHEDEDKRRYLGNFNDDHGFGGGALLSQHLKEQARKYYGTPFLALLDAITQESREDLAKYISSVRDNFKFVALQNTASGQANRAADKFALIAAAGEYATKLGITGWQSGWATHAAQHCFKAWLYQRGGDGNLEDKQAIDHVREMLLKYGESRFTRWEGDGAKVDEHAPRTMERWGFRKTITTIDSMEGDSTETIFYIPTKLFDDVCKGFSKARVGELLAAKGALVERDPPNDKGYQRPTKRKRLPGCNPTHCYVISLSQLLEDNTAEPESSFEFDDIPGFE